MSDSSYRYIHISTLYRTCQEDTFAFSDFFGKRDLMYKIFEELMAKKGVRPADVARATGFRKGFFTDWKSGRSHPKADKLQVLADYFGVPLEYMLTGEMPSDSFTDQELALLFSFRRLNGQGQAHALEYLTNLAELEKYQKKTQSSSRSVG